MERTYGFLMPAILLVGIVLYLDFGTGTLPFEPTFTSKWQYVKAQDKAKSDIFVHFPDSVDTTTRPVKVTVEVRVKDGGDSYIFNAFGSSTRDDDRREKYGGVIYFYNASGVLILLPSNINGYSSGRAVYCGETKDWYHPTSHENKTISNIEFMEADVRVKMWHQNDLPPVYDSGFVYTMRSRNLSKGAVVVTYLEVPVNMTSHPDMVVVQAEPIYRFSMMPGLISEGNGMPACLRCGIQSGSLTFAYNVSHVRLWVKSMYPIISAVDGWGGISSNRIITYTARVRILAWKFDNAVNSSAWIEKMTTRIDFYTTTTPKLVFPREVATEDFIVLVLIRPLKGPNGGFSFYGAGSVVTSGKYDTLYKYSGLVYSYNNFGVYVWRVKPTKMSFVFDVDYPWGKGFQRQQTNDVEIDIHVIGLMFRDVHCPQLKNPADGTVVLTSGRHVSDVAVYNCNPDFVSEGNLTRICLKNGTWSGKPAVCLAKRRCTCPCDKVHVAKYTTTQEEALIKDIEKMKKELMVLKNETSVAMKKKISVKDLRPSATASGAVWVIFLLVVVSVIVVQDVISAVRYILHVYERHFKKS